jgi:hypothetical protein
MPSERNKLRAGGRQTREYMEREWSLHLEDGEVQSNAEIDLEEKVYELDKENKKLQKEVKEAKCKEQKAQDKIARMSEQILKAQGMGYTPTRGHSRVKSPSKCSKRHQRKLKRKREERCAEALAWLEHDGYLPSKLILSNIKTGETETVTLHECEPLQADESTEEEVNIINMILYLKDRYNISGVFSTICVCTWCICVVMLCVTCYVPIVYIIGNAYHEMAQLFKSMPRHYKLKNRISQLNTLWNISLTPDGTVGVQQKLEERLQFCLQNLVWFHVLNAKRGSKILLVFVLVNLSLHFSLSLSPSPSLSPPHFYLSPS